MRQTDFFVILGHFLPFYLINNPKNQNFEKMKKKPPRESIILHKCTINANHMMYGSWDVKRDWQNFLSFWAIFCLLTNRKIKIFKKWKKKESGYIIILHQRTKNHDHMLYCSWNKARDGCNTCFWFWAIFYPFTPLAAWKTKIYKHWKKNVWIYHHFTHVY